MLGETTKLPPLSVSSITQTDWGKKIHCDLPCWSHARAIADFEPTEVLRGWGVG
jgi:hypothetical protein